MKMSVLFFAGLRDLTGADHCELELEGATASVESIEKRLLETFPRLHFSGVRVAVNEEFVETGTEVRDGDVVAFIPPVSGG